MKNLIAIGFVVLVACSTACSSDTHAARQAAHHHPGLSDRQFSAAVQIARHQVRAADASVTVATATLRNGTVTDSNTGHRCVSGKLLHIEILGDFPHIVAAGRPAQPGRHASNPLPGAVHAELIDADALTRKPCLLSVRTGEVRRDPRATTLFTH